MPTWMIEIEGTRFDLQELLRLNTLEGISITEENGRYYLRSGKFNLHTEAREVLNRGTEILRVINGIAQLEVQNWENVEVRGVAREEANGTRTQFIFPEPIRGRSRISAHAKVTKSDGTVDTIHQKSKLESFFE